MPIKLKFEDRNTRLHFERSIKANCSFRAIMSLLKPISEEQALFVRVLKDRYPDEIVTARPDSASLHFIAFKKRHNEKKWMRCGEAVPIPHGIMLPDYKVRSVVALLPAVTVGPVGDASQAPEQMQIESATTPSKHCNKNR
jgi:hypothetical protein